MESIARYLELKKLVSAYTTEMEQIKKDWLDKLTLGTTDFGAHSVTISERFRVDLDKERVLQAVGVENYKSLEKITSYKVVTVK